MIVGIDLDNTLINYDAVFTSLAVDAGMKGDLAGSKDAVKQAVLDTVADGDMVWQSFQAKAYGPLIGRATLAFGALEFLRACKSNKIAVWVVSHKTRYSPFDRNYTDLHEAALNFLRGQELFRPETGLSDSHVLFEPTRLAKAERIAALGCDVFVDDLAETFQEPAFPVFTRKILYSPHGERPPGGFDIAADWNAVMELVLTTPLKATASLGR